MPESRQRKRRRRNPEKTAGEPRKPSPEEKTKERREERKAIVSLLDQDYQPPRWTQPGEMEPPPGASPELLAATADVYLMQNKLFEQLFAQAAEEPEESQQDRMLGALGPFQVNMDDVQDLLTQIWEREREEEGDGPEQPENGIIQELEGSVRSFSTLQQDYFAELIEHPPETDSEGLPLPMTAEACQAIAEARLRANAEAMRHCAWKSSSGETGAQREAYRHLLFELHHWTRNLAKGEQGSILNATARQAVEQCEEIHARQMERFHQETPVELGPAFERAAPAVRAMAGEIGVEPVGFIFGVLTDPETYTQPDGRGVNRKYNYHYSYVAYHHDGKRHIHGLGDPHARGFSGEATFAQMNRVATELQHPDPELENPAVSTAVLKAALAVADTHCVTREGMQELLQQSRSLRISDGAVTRALHDAMELDRPMLEDLMEAGGVSQPCVSRTQAQAVIQAGRKAGLSSHQLAPLCEAMLWDNEKMGVHCPAVPAKSAEKLLAAAERAGFDSEAAKEFASRLTLDG